MNGKERIQAMLAGHSTDHYPLMPITMMFAADQIGRSYYDYVRDHRVLVEAQLFVADRFGFDHVSCISDPARESADLGAAIQWFDNQPPALIEEDSLLADKTVLGRLLVPDPSAAARMADRIQAIDLFRQRLQGEKWIEGWVEGPCALAADLRGVNRLLTDFLDDPLFVVDLLDFCIEMALQFARPQIEAGADIIGVGDAACSLIGPRLYDEFIWKREKKLVDSIHRMNSRVRLHICGRTRKLLPAMGRLGADIIDLDYPAPLHEARAVMGPNQVLTGNIDPVSVLRNGTPEMVKTRLEECRQAAAPNWMVNAGCEVVRDTSLINLEIMTAFARESGPVLFS
jgi:MtaA/CmuA family methyltransferase